MADQSLAPAPVARKNGRVPACEPCRKSKLACDHERPVCRRCIQRGKQSSCEFVNAPMTGLGVAVRGQKRKADSIEGSAISPRPDSISARSELSHSTTNGGGHASSNNHSSIPEKRESVVHQAAAHGFLGSTSFIASLKESQVGIDRLSETDDALDDPEHSNFPAHFGYDVHKIEEGARVLNQILTASQAESLDELLVTGPDGACLVLPQYMVDQCWQSLKRRLLTATKQPGQDGMLALSRTLFENTTKPLKAPWPRTFQEYTALFTDDNLRWEAVGILLAWADLRYTPSYRMRAKTSISAWQQRRKRLTDGATSCLQFCDDLNASNDIVICILYTSCVGMTQFFGDASFLAWKRLGDLSSSLYALGLHQHIKATDEVPPWLVQLRKALVYRSYFTDKSIAMFTGRPPRISSRYISLEPPLALPNCAIALPPEEFEIACDMSKQSTHRLDNVDLFDRLSPLYLPVIITREQVLELFIGPPIDDLENRALGLETQSAEQWQSVPAEYKYDHAMWDSDLSADDCLHNLLLYLDVLYNDFFIQRIKVQRLNASPEKLFKQASELIARTLDLLEQRHRIFSEPFNVDWPWMFALFALPPAGVLALELLQQTKENKPSCNFPCKSLVIQNLSVLVSALAWISKPGEGDYVLLQQARGMLQRVLDRILTPEPSTPATEPLSTMPGGFPTDFTVFDDPFWFGSAGWGDIGANLEEHSTLFFNSSSLNTLAH